MCAHFVIYSGRVVTLTSSVHNICTGGIQFDDLFFEKNYSMFPAYGHSKLANALFTVELQRR
jgi:hypothetical protein